MTSSFEESLANEDRIVAEQEANFVKGEQFHNPNNPKTKTDEAANTELAKDNTETDDEKNENEDGSTAEENANTQLTILVNGETVQISEDFTGTHVQNKEEGHGIHVQKNGDIIVLSGSGGKGKGCGGRLLINTKSGQITKSGPVVEEITASSKDSSEDGSTTTEGAGNSQIAYSGSFSGDHEVEVQGTKYVKARDIVLDATDTLTIRGTKVIVDVDEWVESTGMKKTVVDTIEEEVTSQRTSEVKEDTSRQYDTRASQNVVGTGHVNQKVLGDWKIAVAGTVDLQIQGENQPNGLNAGVFGLTVGLNNDGITGGLRLNANDQIQINTKDENIMLNSGKGIGIDAYALDDPPANGEVRISGSTAGVKMVSWSGASESNSTSVKVTEDGAEITAKKKVEIEAKTEDVNVKASIGDVKIEGVKIYLN